MQFILFRWGIDVLEREEYEKLQQRVKSALIKFTGSSRLYEDCTQELAYKWVSRGGRKGQTVDQFVIDYLRKISGRKGTKFYELRKNLNRPCPIEVNGYERSNVGHGSDTFKHGASIEVDLLDDINSVEKHFLLEKGIDITEELGVSEARVSQIKKKILLNVERKYFLKILGVNNELK